jgi:hypothetical protein
MDEHRHGAVLDGDQIAERLFGAGSGNLSGGSGNTGQLARYRLHGGAHGRRADADSVLELGVQLAGSQGRLLQQVTGNGGLWPALARGFSAWDT